MAFAAVIIAGLVITGFWDKVKDFFTNSSWGATIIFIIVIAIAISIIMAPAKKEEKKSEK